MFSLEDTKGSQKVCLGPYQELQASLVTSCLPSSPSPLSQERSPFPSDPLAQPPWGKREGIWQVPLHLSPAHSGPSLSLSLSAQEMETPVGPLTKGDAEAG